MTRAGFVFGLLLAVAACGKSGGATDTPGSASGASKTTDENLQREQARFDSERRPELVVEALNIHPGSRVADVGAGTGLLTVHLAKAVAPNGLVVATDIDSAVLELLHNRLAAANLDGVVERRVVDAETPGLEAGAYDAILLAEVDHYFQDPVAWLQSAQAALKPGGRIVISNRIHHRARSMQAGQKAGLELISESTPVPTHFIAVFGAKKDADKPADKKDAPK
ncbi:MAG TPA: class I SAM-dependent methyltransferase [Kofleriaceae bacterium]